VGHPRPGGRGDQCLVGVGRTERVGPGLRAIQNLLTLTPRFDQVPEVEQLWNLTRGIADAFLVLIALVGGILLMVSSAVGTRYTMKLIVSRLLLAAVLANLSLSAFGMVDKKVNVITLGGKPVAGPLAPWRDTEQALGISESGRKAKVAILRLDMCLQDELRTVPAEHAIQIARLDDPAQQAVLVARARHLTHRQVHDAVERLRADPELTVDAALESSGGLPESADPIAFEVQASRSVTFAGSSSAS